MFSLVYYGNGGWTWEIVYDLPIHIRRYCLKLLNDAKQQEKRQMDEQSNQNKGSGGKPQIPDIVRQNIAQGAPTKRPPRPR